MTRGLVAVAVVLLLAACASDRLVSPTPEAPEVPGSGGPELATQYWCETHPVECHSGGLVDPDSSAPGLFLGATLAPQTCFSPTGTNINDADYDGMHDYCENTLASVFRPTLISSPYDCSMGMEPYYAVKYFPQEDGNNIVRIAYLFGYYLDCGAPNPGAGCAILQAVGQFGTFNGLLPDWNIGVLPFKEENVCDGHIGDSEFITVDLKYNTTAMHWYTDNVYFSAHWKTENDRSRRTRASKLEWTDKYGGSPLVYVALGKHANYPTRATCEAGLLHDNCDGNAVETPLSHNSYHNIGSAQRNLINTGSCVTGGALVQYYPENYRTECFWTSSTFAGWDLYGPGVTPYKTELVFQFECRDYYIDFGAPGLYVCTDWGVNRLL